MNKDELQRKALKLFQLVQKGDATALTHELKPLDETGRIAIAHCTFDGRDLLQYAAEKGNLKVAGVLLKYGKLDADSHPGMDNNPICIAYRWGNLDMFLFLLAHGADPNDALATIIHGPGKTIDPKKERRALKKVLKWGPLVDTRTIYTIQRILEWKSRLAVWEYLLECKCQIKISNATDTPFHSAAQDGDLNALKRLLEKGLGVNVSIKWGVTALHLAAEHNQVEAVRLLLHHGADREIKTDGGFTPLMYAERNLNAQVVIALGRGR